MSSPKLTGLDTSFVLRLLTGEPEEQATLAVKQLDYIVAEGGNVAVSDLVVAEAYFALQYHYNVPKQVALNSLQSFLESPDVVPLGHSMAVLKEPNLSKAKPGFVDRMIHAVYLNESNGMLTFEKSAKKLPGVTVLV